MRTQLCLGLAALAVHVPVDRWTLPAPGSSGGGGGGGSEQQQQQQQAGVVRWFAAKFGALPPDTALPCMLELLTVLPQVGGPGVWGWGACVRVCVGLQGCLEKRYRLH